MRLLFLPVIAWLMLGAMPAAALPVGKPAPDFTVRDASGVEQSLTKYKGKIVVMEWSNPGCPFIQKHYASGNMQALQKYAASKDVVWISVNSNAEGREGYMKAEEAQQWLIRNKAEPTAYLLDPEGELGHIYGAKATPHMFVIAKDGTLAYEGALDDKPSPDPDDIKTAKNYVKAALDSLLEDKPVATPQTRAYGCSVKYKE